MGNVYRVRDFAYVDDSTGECWAKPGEFVVIPEGAWDEFWRYMRGQEHKLLEFPEVPRGGKEATLPADLTSSFGAVRVQGRSMSTADTTKRSTRRKRSKSKAAPEPTEPVVTESAPSDQPEPEESAE